MNMRTRAQLAGARFAADSRLALQEFLVNLGASFVLVLIFAFISQLVGSVSGQPDPQLGPLRVFVELPSQLHAVALSSALAVVAAVLAILRGKERPAVHRDTSRCKACEEPEAERRFWVERDLVRSAPVLLGMVFWMLFLGTLMQILDQAQSSTASTFVLTRICDALSHSAGQSPPALTSICARLSEPPEASTSVLAPAIAVLALLMLTHHVSTQTGRAEAARPSTTEAERLAFERRWSVIQPAAQKTGGRIFRSKEKRVRSQEISLIMFAVLMGVVVAGCAAWASGAPRYSSVVLVAWIGTAFGGLSLMLVHGYRQEVSGSQSLSMLRAERVFLWSLLMAVWLLLLAINCERVLDGGNRLELVSFIVASVVWWASIAVLIVGYKGRGPASDLCLAAALSFSSGLRKYHRSSKGAAMALEEKRGSSSSMGGTAAGTVTVVPDHRVGDVFAVVRYWDEIEPWLNDCQDENGHFVRELSVNINQEDALSGPFTVGTVVTVTLVCGHWRTSCLTVVDPANQRRKKSVTVLNGGRTIPFRVRLAKRRPGQGTHKPTP